MKTELTLRPARLNDGPRAIRGIASDMPASYRAAILIVLFLVAAILAWCVALLTFRSGRVKGIANEIGSVADLGLGGALPVPDHAGHRLVFFKATEDGVGLFACELTSGRQQSIYEETQAQYETNVSYVKLLDWSPDDRFLAFTRRVKQTSSQEIAVWKPESDEQQQTVVVQNGLTQFTWLAPGAFVYLNKKQELRLIAEAPTGKWAVARTWKKISHGPMRWLTAVSSNSVAWAEGSSVWLLSSSSKAPTKLWECNSNLITGLSYSARTGRFLVNWREGKASRLCLLDPGTRSVSELGRVSENASPVVLANSGQGCAYLSRTVTGHALAVTRSFGGDPVSLFPRGTIRNWVASANNDKLYALASLTNEPPGLWEYDVSLDYLHRVVPATETPFKYCRWVPSWQGWVPGESKPAIAYHLWPPAHFQRGKKYPLVIGGINASVYAEAIANAGGYFVSVDRAAGSGTEHDEWWQDVRTVLAALSKKPSIDASRVFLYGAGRETEQVAKILEKGPLSCRGLILFSPDVLPQLPCDKLPRMLIDDGKDDPAAVSRLAEFQQEAKKLGVPVTLVLHANLRQNAWAQSLKRDRIPPLLTFVFGT
jgi:hypothetical protein